MINNFIKSSKQKVKELKIKEYKREGETYIPEVKLMRRNKRYSITEVLEKVHSGQRYIFDGEEINMNSSRLVNFKLHGTECVRCKMKGLYFYMEREAINPRYHFNLYGIKNGKEVLMTKDHIIPKSRGGKNNQLNYQPMCIPCNMKKGNSLEEELNETSRHMLG